MTKFRGCIDIHSGVVKQIVGATLISDDKTNDNSTTENFVSSKPSSYYAELYKRNEIHGCHVIKLGSNPANDEAAIQACRTWPNQLQVGGGINKENALKWVDTHKASHVILTSWLFTEDTQGKFKLNRSRLADICTNVGKERLVVDLSCRTVIDENNNKMWVVAMNKWQTLTGETLGPDLLLEISEFCDEFLIHAADVEGLCNGIDESLVEMLGEWCPNGFEEKIVYAGGAKSVTDLELVRKISRGKVDLTFGSALDIFGGELVKFDDLVKWNSQKR